MLQLRFLCNPRSLRASITQIAGGQRFAIHPIHPPFVWPLASDKYLLRDSAIHRTIETHFSISKMATVAVTLSGASAVTTRPHVPEGCMGAHHARSGSQHTITYQLRSALYQLLVHLNHTPLPPSLHHSCRGTILDDILTFYPAVLFKLGKT